MFPIVSVSRVLDEAKPFLGDKNPSIKAETTKWLAASFTGCTAKDLSKPVLKSIVPTLVEKLADSAGPVRDAATLALATVSKVWLTRTNWH